MDEDLELGERTGDGCRGALLTFLVLPLCLAARALAGLDGPVAIWDGCIVPTSKAAIVHSEDAPSAAVVPGGNAAGEHAPDAGPGNNAGASPAKDAASADLHIVFSTSCNEFQHWQREVLLHRALAVGQVGAITHIVVGCEEREDKDMKGKRRFITHPAGANDDLVQDWRRSSHDNVEIHYAPSRPEAREFPWFNKPWSFYHWLKEKGDSALKRRVVALVDPDEFFLESMTAEPKHAEAVAAVRPGMGLAQKYGFGSVWLKKFNRTAICGATSYCATITDQEAWRYYPAGPPYFIHRDDFRKVAEKWWEFMAPAYAADRGDILVDMFAYNMAASHVNVKHKIMEDFMVSNPGAGMDEGWKFVDALEQMSCRRPAFPEGATRPTFVHAAVNCRACSGGGAAKDGKCEDGSDFWMFHKGHVPPKILECNTPLLQEPPDDLFNVQQTQNGRRFAFLVCWLHRMVNDAALAFKVKYCGGRHNGSRCVRIASRGDGEFPLARRVC